jgi:hypothetical protein
MHVTTGMEFFMKDDLYEKIEQRTANDLLSEVEQLEPIIRKDYADHVLATAPEVDKRPAETRIQEMESRALDVYEEALSNKDVPFNQRRAVADKVLEITGVIDTSKGKGESGNTFVFSDTFAQKFLNAAGKVSDALRVVSDA